MWHHLLGLGSLFLSWNTRCIHVAILFLLSSTLGAECTLENKSFKVLQNGVMQADFCDQDHQFTAIPFAISTISTISTNSANKKTNEAKIQLLKQEFFDGRTNLYLVFKCDTDLDRVQKEFTNTLHLFNNGFATARPYLLGYWYASNTVLNWFTEKKYCGIYSYEGLNLEQRWAEQLSLSSFQKHTLSLQLVQMYQRLMAQSLLYDFKPAHLIVTGTKAIFVDFSDLLDDNEPKSEYQDVFSKQTAYKDPSSSFINILTMTYALAATLFAVWAEEPFYRGIIPQDKEGYTKFLEQTMKDRTKLMPQAIRDWLKPALLFDDQERPDRDVWLAAYPVK